MRAIVAALAVLLAGIVSAEAQVFTQEDLERYQGGISASDTSSSRGRASDNAGQRQTSDSNWEQKRSAEERSKLLSDCIQSQDQQYKLEWDRICRSDNQPPGCLLVSYKRYELQDRRDDGKRDCYRQYSY